MKLLLPDAYDVSFDETEVPMIRRKKRRQPKASLQRTARFVVAVVAGQVISAPIDDSQIAPHSTITVLGSL